MKHKYKMHPIWFFHTHNENLGFIMEFLHIYIYQFVKTNSGKKIKDPLGLGEN